MNEWFANPLFWVIFLPLLSVAVGAIFALGQWKGRVDSGKNARSTPHKMFVVLSIIGSLFGIGALLFLLYLFPIKITISEDDINVYDKLSFHMWILEMVLLTVGISVAVLGFIGYQSIKDEAIKKATDEAVKKAKEEARREFTRWDDNLRGLRSAYHQVQPDSTEEEAR